MENIDVEFLKKLVQKNLNAYLEANNISAYALEKKMNLTMGTLYKAREGLSIPGFATLHTMKVHDPFLNLNWFVANSGPAKLGSIEYSSPEEFMGVMEEKQAYELKYIDMFNKAEKYRKQLEECKAELAACQNLKKQ